MVRASWDAADGERSETGVSAWTRLDGMKVLLVLVLLELLSTFPSAA